MMEIEKIVENEILAFFFQPWERLSERTSERSEAREPTNLSGAREQSEQCRAIK